MPLDPIATRYARALFEAAKADDELDEALEQLTLIGGFFQAHADLRQLMRNPGVDPEDKVGVLDRVLKGSWSALTRAFVEMVVSRERAEFLPQIAEALQAEVDADRGHLRVAVRSAHPLPAEVLARLGARLERQEHKQIELRTEIDPSLIGGVQVVLGHRVIDGSVRRQLVNLRERLSTVRVY